MDARGVGRVAWADNRFDEIRAGQFHQAVESGSLRCHPYGRWRFVAEEVGEVGDDRGAEGVGIVGRVVDESGEDGAVELAIDLHGEEFGVAIGAEVAAGDAVADGVGQQGADRARSASR